MPIMGVFFLSLFTFVYFILEFCFVSAFAVLRLGLIVSWLWNIANLLPYWWHETTHWKHGHFLNFSYLFAIFMIWEAIFLYMNLIIVFFQITYLQEFTSCVITIYIIIRKIIAQEFSIPIVPCFMPRSHVGTPRWVGPRALMPCCCSSTQL